MTRIAMTRRRQQAELRKLNLKQAEDWIQMQLRIFREGLSSTRFDGKVRNPEEIKRLVLELEHRLRKDELTVLSGG